MMTKKQPKIIVILGPTASGKSKLAVKIAKKFNGEIISADSRQVYKGLDIGTEKIGKKEMSGVKHHLLDITDPKKVYTVAQYQKTAKKILKQILKNRKIPLIVGGSGFYIDALIYDYKLPAVAPQKSLRKKLEKKSTAELFKKLQELDSQRATNIDSQNRRRLIRALEIIIMTRKPIGLLRPFNKFRVAQSGVEGRQSQDKKSKYDFLKIGIKKSPVELRQLINQRLEKTLRRGLIKETKKLHQKGLSWKRLEELGMEYRLASYYLRSLISRQQMINQMQREIYRYAKRQMTWFSAKGGSASGGKRNENIKWVKNYPEAEKLIRNFLK